MLGRNDEDEFVEKDDDGLQAGVLGFVGEDSEFGTVAQDIVGNVAAQSTFDGDTDHGMQAAEFRENRKQVKDGKFVGGDDQFAFLQLTEFGERFGGFRAEIDQLLGILVEDFPRVGKDAFAGGAVEQSFAEFVFQLTNGLADGRLGAEEFVGSAGETALAGYGQEDFQLGKVHGLVNQTSHLY